MEIVKLTVDQAISCLNEGDEIHTFRNPGVLIGADRSRNDIIEALKNAVQIEIGGQQCKSMGHGLVARTSRNDPLFIECNMDKINAFDVAN